MKRIPGFDGYWATEDGQIVSTKDGERVIAQRYKDGYAHVTLSVRVDGRRQRHCHAVHRLVNLAFSGLPPEGRGHTRHLNGVRGDNRASNLAWGSPKENSQDAVSHGTLGKGMQARRRKLTEDQVRDIRARISAGESTHALAEEFGVSSYYPNALAHGCSKRRTWSHLE